MWYNPIMRGLLNSPFHYFASKNMMLMTYTGRKSGKSYTVPMSYLENGGVLYTISSRERVWWRNLRSGRDVSLHLKGVDVLAHSESIENESQIADVLSNYFKSSPQLAKYMKVRIDAQGNPNPEDIMNLAQEKVIVRSELK